MAFKKERTSRETSRNIIIIGCSGSGKSTIASKLDPRIDPRKDRFGKFSPEICYTEGPTVFHETADESVRTEKETYCITVIDTIGYESERFRREHVENFFKTNEIDHINLIIIVIRQGRITGYERDLLQSIKLIFNADALEKTLAFVISYCEQYNTKVCKSLVESINKFYLSIFPELVIPVERIITTGLPSAEHLKVEIFDYFKDSIRDDVAKLQNLIINAKESVDINNLFEVSKHFRINEHVYMPRRFCLIV